MADITITRVIPRTDITAQGTFSETFDVYYTIDGVEHSVNMPKSKYSAKAAEAAVTAAAAEITTVQGKKITLK
jgi:hypothetical protein